MDKFGWVDVLVILIKFVHILTCSQNYLGQPRECYVSFFINFIAGHGLLTGFYVLFCFVFQNGVLICFSRIVLTSSAHLIVPIHSPE